MSERKQNEFGEWMERCTYYQGRGKCAFHGQNKCVWDDGWVHVLRGCGVEDRMEYEAMYGGRDE